MREPLEIIMYRNCEIEIHSDDNAESPNEWDNDLSFLLHDHRDFSTHPSFMDRHTCQDIYDSAWSQGKVTYNHKGKNYWIFPVFAYIHSGVTLYLNRKTVNQFEPTGFDTSFKGFCLVDKTEPDMWAKDDAFKVAESVIKEWNQYLDGDVYGYITKYDSCWNFYGDDGKKQMIEEAKAGIDHAMHQELLKKINKVKTMILNKVPLEVREKIIPVTE